MDCCPAPDDYQGVFGDRFARRVTKEYRRKGLNEAAQRVLAAIPTGQVPGASVLEIGGGVGQLQLELLRRGAARSTNLELVDSYEADARALASEAGVADRIQRRRLDLAGHPDAVEPHDIVILHRVVCCYPDYDRLLSAAAGRTRQILVFSHPPRNRLTRAAAALENAWLRLRRQGFRGFVHEPADMIASAEREGLGLVSAKPGRRWCVVTLAR